MPNNNLFNLLLTRAQGGNQPNNPQQPKYSTPTTQWTPPTQFGFDPYKVNNNAKN